MQRTLGSRVGSKATPTLEGMPEVEQDLLSIGQVAERTGLSVHTLRFYEREGILANPVSRGPGGRRCYSESDVEWLRLCIILRASGMERRRSRRGRCLREALGNRPLWCSHA
ncbi:MerR HTH family regulatory protein [Streptosporangium canum]|uniref:MerR HTH family regulatory protein n=3 Tax=Streptosporangium canum TaxID=324952 RepID=A0A1I4DSQ8_9ACTN|nr:MerR HTH family regulatory protein [Streptosporangium canum]